jgi:hypothetical protein
VDVFAGFAGLKREVSMRHCGPARRTMKLSPQPPSSICRAKRNSQALRTRLEVLKVSWTLASDSSANIVA